ncbi:MAG: hypothetical protein FWG57_00800 [Endomicrobia bacterium]|jgi:hypothetical protein|nr:hypothetical protein [Endomicrobiia bacterium]
MINQSLKENLLKFITAFVASFIFAIACYDILLFFGIKPFADFYRMYAYHSAYYWQFIFIMCFVFSILAVLFSKKFKTLSLKKQILLTLLIIVLTIIISSPIGGMLWHLHDMLAGHFPKKWLWKLIRYGFREGVQMGWLIILFSAPYNLIGAVISFFVMKTVADFPWKKEKNDEEI